ncbi:Organic hydroperoxide resistance protein OhrA [Bacillus sp. FJAT-22090]|uniref:Ohr family peroxiredoxin n=1 Tax=Bacillus sp. FJAT-22090 TaxID=1581038 RepID=UPI0006AE1572|nr:Ohr family peroxiredoxin [Bacillus sp. FJAT-22090]ALC87403.1 Organic hydroperoxide resistance protein OhrA [Bacillus sp. FJAT-22090]
MSDILYTSTVTAVGGRERKVQSSDGVINLETVLPGSQREESEKATNPEQLFAAAYAACFDSALQIVASKEQVKFDSEVTANVGISEEDEGYRLAIHLQVKGNNIEKSQLEDFVQKANQIWPYSEEKRANMDFTIEVQ